MQKVIMHQGKETEYSPAELAAIVHEVQQTWREAITKIDSLLENKKEPKIAFTAGAGLPPRFGKPESGISQELFATQVEGKINLAGIDFTTQELETIGSYYSFLHQKGVKLLCIDERLDHNIDSADTSTHEKCGACAVVGATINFAGNLEDRLMAEDGTENFGKQPILEDMPLHESMAIFIDFHGTDVLTDEAKRILKEKKALPFNVSFDLNMIREWLQETHIDQNMAVDALTKWNVLIAANIISGDHNTLHALRNELMLISDIREVVDQELHQDFMKSIRRLVAPKTELVIE